MKKLHKIGLFFIMIAFSFLQKVDAKTEINSQSELKLTTIDKAIEECKVAKKKFILVDLYTEWCGWCKKMDENVFTDAQIISLLNSDFTVVKFDAETKDAVNFNSKSYTFAKTGARGANQLAMELGSTGGKLGYPTLVILDATGKKLQAFPGYKDIQTLTAILKYFQSESYNKIDFQQFQSGQ